MCNNIEPGDLLINRKRLLQLANEIISSRKQKCDISDLKTLVNDSISELEFCFDRALLERVLNQARIVLRQGPNDSVALLVEKFIQSFMNKTTENNEKLFMKEIKHLLDFKWPICDSNMETCSFPKQLDDLALQLINNNNKLAEYALKTIIAVISREIASGVSCQQINKIIHLYKLAQKLSVIYKFKETQLIKLKKLMMAGPHILQYID